MSNYNGQQYKHREYRNNDFSRDYNYDSGPSSSSGHKSYSSMRKKSYQQQQQHPRNEAAGGSGSIDDMHFDVRSSNLKPDAREFYPSSSASSTGALPKKSSHNNRYQSNWYNSKSKTYNGNAHDSERDTDRRNDYHSGASNSSYKSKSYYDQRNGSNHYKSTKHKYNNYYEHNSNSRNNFKERYKSSKLESGKDLSKAGQRETLTDLIDSNNLECMVCCEKIKRSDKAWSCSQCYHIFHLSCTIEWATSSKAQNTWRCPACQNNYSDIPTQYLCFCGQTIDPKMNPNIIAHSCDNMCLKKGRSCEHKCSIPCHPGPCPECNIMVAKSCGCGLTQQTVKCCSDVKIVCDAICKKLLNCEVHTCVAICHADSCSPCSERIIQECYCGKTGRKVPCDQANAGKTSFACENRCDKPLQCGNHNCKKTCHEGPCESCPTDVTAVTHCPCGKTPLKIPRTSCLDPVPCCDNPCGKQLICGPPSQPHSCKKQCHVGKCPPCPLTTVVKCRCGHMDKEIACDKLTTRADDARCEKKCPKKRLCGKHTCKQKCCIEFEHVCPLPCNKVLSCGLHRCQLTCHSGRCPPCMETSFEELLCACGSSVLYPPISCGTKPPICKKPCTKRRPCGHPPNHDCHPGPCPPCFVLTKQWCYGKHEQRAAIPCEQNSFSCGLPCGKPMPCGRHKCVKPCHEKECATPCTQPCTILRVLCGHPCGKPCHEPPCPESICKQMVPVTCPCGLQKSSRPCVDLTDEYKNIEMAQLKDKMLLNASYNQTMDLSDVSFKKPAVLKILECTEECKVLERNRRLAIGLQIQNPDISQKLTPKYSEYLRQWAKKDPKFCQRIHDKLSELVQLAKQSKQKSRSHSFESMNRDKRHFIHEYCEYFGIESAAYDAEPNRNVIATAIKDKSWLPSMGLLEVLQRENGQRKVPRPVLGYSNALESETVSLKLLTSAKRTD